MKWQLEQKSFTDKDYEDACVQYPKQSFVFLTETKQIGIVEDVKDTADGPAVKVFNIGLVPIGEVKNATEDQITNSKFNGYAKKVGDTLFLSEE
jgi:hypothetical protein